MSKDLNQCNFIGRMGGDPTVRYSPDGKAVANISLACGWKSKDKEGVEWVKVVFFGKLAEIVGEYLKKGSQIFVEGRLQTRKWQDKDGQDRYTTEIVANQMQMLGSRGGADTPPEDCNKGHQQSTGGIPAAAPATDDFDDDIPF